MWGLPIRRLGGGQVRRRVRSGLSAGWRSADVPPSHPMRRGCVRRITRPEAHRVKSMKPLLPQPGGFQGLRPALKQLDVNDLAVPNNDHLADVRINVYCACNTASEDATKYHH